MNYITTIDGKEFNVEIVDEKCVRVNGQELAVDFQSVSGQPVFSLLIGGKSYEAYIYPDERDWQVLLRGRLYQASVEDEREKRLKSAAGGAGGEGGEYHLKSPMPGLIVAIPVSEGQLVEKGQTLLILESMKMQNELKAPRAGTIQRIRVKPGETVEQKATLLTVA
ncbi:MAG: acetyl-CoA carboxylase biotin carboxyl carrier protein subunit [Anaerolineales bacterium]